MILLLLACKSEEPPTPTPATATPPPTVPWVDTGIFRPSDTGEDPTLDDDVPDHTLEVVHSGYWERSGTPYDAVVGELHVREILDGYVPDTSDTGDQLACDVRWFVTGTPDSIVHTCPGCDPGWEVTFTYDEASVSTLALCNDRELPDDGSVWHLALHPGDGVIYYNWFGSGVWLPWWNAEEVGDRVDYGWQGQIAVGVEEEEE